MSYSSDPQRPSARASWLVLLLILAWPLLILLTPGVPDQDSSYMVVVASGSAHEGLFNGSGGLLGRPSNVQELSRLWRRSAGASARDVWLASYAQDLHPPLYMLLLYFSSYVISPDLHTTGFVLNLLFYACSLGLVWWLCRLLGGSPRQCLVALFLVSFSQYGWRVLTPVRMYGLLHCLVLAYALGVIKLQQAEEARSGRQARLLLLCLALLALAGALTSFLFPVLTFFIFLAGLWQLRRYRWAYLGVHAAAVAAFVALMLPALPSYLQANFHSPGMSAHYGRLANLLEHIPKLLFPTALAALAVWRWWPGESGRRPAAAVALAGAGAASLLYWLLWAGGAFIYWAIGWKYQGTFLLFAAPLVAVALRERRRLLAVVVAASLIAWVASSWGYLRVQYRMNGLLSLYEVTRPDLVVCDNPSPSRFPVVLRRAPQEAEVICAEAASLPALLRAHPKGPRRVLYWSCGATAAERRQVLAALQGLTGSPGPARKAGEFTSISAWTLPSPALAQARHCASSR